MSKKIKQLKTKIDNLGQQYFGSQLKSLIGLTKTDYNTRNFNLIVVFKSGHFIVGKSSKSNEVALNNIYCRLRNDMREHGNHLQQEIDELRQSVKFLQRLKDENYKWFDKINKDQLIKEEQRLAELESSYYGKLFDKVS